MTQISRPFQIVLAVFALFVAVWFVALRAHNSNTGGGSGSSASGSSAPVTQTASAPAKAKVKAIATSTHSHHGATTTRAVTVTHSATTHAGRPTSTAAVTVKHAVKTGAGTTTVVHTTVVKHTAAKKVAPAKTKASAGVPSMQIAVEHELQQNKTVLILFWNPKGADDNAVHRELPAVQHKLGGKVAVHYASAGQVGAYGTITHAVQVTQTPTLLIVNPHGQTTTLTGLTDAFSIEQSISEAGKS
jgi:hypothetical protein